MLDGDAAHQLRVAIVAWYEYRHLERRAAEKGIECPTPKWLGTNPAFVTMVISTLNNDFMWGNPSFKGKGVL